MPARRHLSVLLLVAVAVAGCLTVDPPRIKSVHLVEDAHATLAEFGASGEEPMKLFRREMQKAAGVVIFPEVLKAAFVVGGEGGNGVLLARKDDGTWTYPAFYTMGAGSVGLQIGGQASEIILVLRNKGAVDAVIKNQGKLGGDLEVTVGTIGAGIEGATTTNLGADILVFARSAGVYGGLSLEGAVLARRNDWNEAYYADGATATGIVQQGKYANPKADPLRDALAKF
ncbi:MAG: lipid-binding SYLF domain-containing protein [Hyphomicrobiales bacterium]|nr:lipid-binding SYLF domain-containing protein [Hyphomicrobiales bacterium]MCP5370101.1 lipid-binding SYLF domain-containing protein [Hyphomicrobiales bacterium]